MASRLVNMSYLSTNSSLRRSCSMETYMVRIHPGSLALSAEFISVEALKNTRADEIAQVAVQKLRLGNPDLYELAETFSSGGQLCKERRLEPLENPVRIQLLWPRVVNLAGDAHRTEYRFYLRRKEPDRKVGSWVEFAEPNPIESFLSAFLTQPKNKEYPDLCNLPDLNETTLLRNLASRFQNGNIYTYVGSILISVNPFKFYPIYNPKYVKMYQNRRLGDLPPHIFAIADAAYHTMLQEKRNQCIVISGESGSGKTESTNLLLHHLSALSQRAVHGTGVEQTILGAGPVLEAFGNAKTVHNNNSSRFGKFIQVNYKENGMVHGAVVEKYLLEKSRIVSQAQNERNYHVFYYLLAGASDTEKEVLWLTNPTDYFYLNQSKCYTLEGIDGEFVDEAHEFTRLKQSMEMVGFCTELQRRIFSVLAAVLHLGNIEFRRKADHQHHEAVSIKNIATVKIISSLLKVKESTLVEALTRKRTTAGGETVVMSYNMADAVQTRDAMAKCLYGGLFDWIVLQVNHALLSKQEMREHQGNSIGVLDIFGFEDFGKNSFEQFCINYANERLHYYFNQHIFKFEQEEYVREGIQWKNIEFIDNTQCLDLFAKKPTGLLYLLDEECNFPGATNSTLLDKFHAQHQNNPNYEVPQMRESAFSVVHYAGKVKYHIQDFREKNSDLIRQDIMLVLKNSSLAFVRELVGYDPVAVLRWAIIRAFFRAYFAFIDAGRRHRRSSGTTTAQTPAWNKFGAILRQPTSSQRAQHLSLPSGDMSDNRKVVIVEKPISRRNHRHVSYHGDICADLDVVNGVPVATATTAGAKECWEGADLTLEGTAAMVGERGGVAVHENEAWGADGLLSESDSRVMRRASRVLMKSKSFKPRTRPAKTFRDLKSMKTLAGKTVLGPRSSKSKNKSPSVSTQFCHSLSKLMETLNQANPFFIRCIKSNADKAPCKFDEEIVLRQLRYTGMLATVKIRQSGYNYRLTFEEFIQQYKILLPKGLVSSKDDVRDFLEHLDLNTENFQIGKTKLHVKHVVEKHLKDMNYQIAETKVFLREAEKLLLDDALHQSIMKHIVHIQRWARTRLERQRFLRMRVASVIIQAQVRSFLAQRKLNQLRLQFYATLLIQKAFRGFRERKRLRQQRDAAVCIQRNVRGFLARKQTLMAATIDLDVYVSSQSHFARKGAVRRYRLLRDEREREHLQQKLLQRQKEIEQQRQEKLLQQRSHIEAEVPKGQHPFRRADDRRQGSDQWGRLLETQTEHIPPTTGTITTPLQPVSGVLPAIPDTLDGQPCPTSPQGGEGRATETIDLHSSASDEGILTKESSTEELLMDRDLDLPRHTHGHDSEESSGILDDSEPDNISVETPRTKSRGSSFTTPPSTPHSPQPFGLDGGDGRVPPLALRQNSGQHFPSGLDVAPRLRTQQGPRDLEICIRPAIQKSASEESFQSAASDLASGAAWREKRISAPLAKQESITDNLDYVSDGSHVRRVSLNEERKSEAERKDIGDTGSLSLTGSGGNTPHRGAFHRAKRHIKNIMAERTPLAESPGFESPREEDEDGSYEVFTWESRSPTDSGEPLPEATTTTTLTKTVSATTAPTPTPAASSLPGIQVAPAKALSPIPLVMDVPPKTRHVQANKVAQSQPVKTLFSSTKKEKITLVVEKAADDVETGTQTAAVKIAASTTSQDAKEQTGDKKALIQSDMLKEEKRTTVAEDPKSTARLSVTGGMSSMTVPSTSPKRTLQQSKSLPPEVTRSGEDSSEGSERLLAVGQMKETASETDVRRTAPTGETPMKAASEQSVCIETESESSSSRSESSQKNSVISLTRMPPLDRHDSGLSDRSSVGVSGLKQGSIGHFHKGEVAMNEAMESGTAESEWRWSVSSSDDSRRSSLLSHASTNIDSSSLQPDSRRNSAQDSSSLVSMVVDSPARFEEMQNLPLEARTVSAQELSTSSTAGDVGTVQVTPEERALMRLERRRSSTPDTRKPEPLARGGPGQHSLPDTDRPEDIVHEAARISTKEAMKAQWLLSHTPSVDLTGHEDSLRRSSTVKQTSGGREPGGLVVKERIQRSKTIDVVSQSETSTATEVVTSADRTTMTAREKQKADWLLSSPNQQQNLQQTKASDSVTAGQNVTVDKKVELVMRTAANQEKLLDFGPADRRAKERKLETRPQKKWGLMDDAGSSKSGSSSPKSESPRSKSLNRERIPGRGSPTRQGSPKMAVRAVKVHAASSRGGKPADKSTVKKTDTSSPKDSPKAAKDVTGKVAASSTSKGLKDLRKMAKKTPSEDDDDKGSTKNVRAVCREVRQAALTRVPAVVVSRDGSPHDPKKKMMRGALKAQLSLSKEVKRAANVGVLQQAAEQARGKLTGGSIISVRDVRASPPGSGSGTSVSPLKRRGMLTSRVTTEHISNLSGSSVSATTTTTTMTSSSSGGKLEETKMTKKGTTTTFMRYSKISFKALLGEHSSGRKNSNKKDSGEDSDNSETEDGPISPMAKYAGSITANKKSDALTRKTKDTLQAEDPRNKRKHRRKGSKKRREEDKKTEPMWNVSSTSQWQYPTDLLVRGAVELQQLDRFVCSKINELSKDCGRRDTVFDVVFKGALKEFYSNLITHTSVAYHKNNVEFRYRDLMMSFEETLKARAQMQELNADFPVTIGINAFRGFLDEFNRKKENKELPKMEVKKEKKKKEKEPYYEHLGHKFVLIQFSIPTYCEYCSSLMWMVEKGNVCQVCKYTVHKKCCNRSLIRCRGVYGDSQQKTVTRVIGAPLESLLDGDQKVPIVVEKLITAVELNGLYTVGIYRKAGAAGKVKQLISAINTDTSGQLLGNSHTTAAYSEDVTQPRPVTDDGSADTDSPVEFNEHPIHVLTSVMKCFFREMPQPLITYDLYDDFIRAAEINDEKERLQCLYSIVDKLPTPNHDLFERLIFHLANVAQHENDNKMSANSLAIIFAPSIIRCMRPLPAQESLQHVPKQTMCLQSIIQEQVRKIRHTLADIKTLNSATATAADRLNAVRASIRNNGTKADELGMQEDVPCPEGGESQRTEEMILSEQILSLQKEKEMLTLRMPALECRHSSSEEDILSTDDLESTGDELEDGEENHEEYAVTFDLPAVSPPKNLRHLTKNRAQTPSKHLPTLRHRSPTASAEAPEDETDGGKSERRGPLNLPELKQVGEEIIV